MAKKRNFDYFDYFRQVSEVALEAARMLDDLLGNFTYESAPDKAARIHELEHRADGEKHGMMEHLTREFITPIERDDIIAVAEKLDDIVDSIDDVARCVYKYNIKSIRPDTRQFTEKIIEICTGLSLVCAEFHAFHSSKKLSDMIIKVKETESEGDVIHADSLRRLYSDDSTDREVMVWTNMYEDLENCLDAAEDCANLIESAVLNNT